MSNFSQQQNPNNYYPEALNLDVKTQSFDNFSSQPQFQQNQSQNFQQNQFQQQAPNFQNNFQQNTQNQQQNTQNNSPLSGLFQGDMSKLFGGLGGNDMLTALFTSGLFGGNAFGNAGNSAGSPNMKNDMLMQALTGMMKPPQKKQSEEHIEKVIEIENTFEDL